MKSTHGVTTNKFLIRDLPGTSGRLDVIFRCILATFSFGFHNRVFHTVLNGPPDPPKSVEFNGNRLKELPQDEIGMALLFQTLLDPLTKRTVEGIHLAKNSFLQIATELSQEGEVFLLQEKSMPFHKYLNELKKTQSKMNSVSFVLSDYLDLNQQEEEDLNQLGVKRISLGSQSYLASHCIVFVLFELKKLGFLDAI